ncbi:hypothetical protein QR680_013008 [Steinernema hermaphroditum]|uniref:BZIP domain-containing protein n=1 Tax=Steinernema hermaphroditum TaxID=289476 RepID=A0AA39I5I2_9BILA|nr:hypothetical protein QR680_013008 [Steinernema hermaphroditum]
MEDYKYLFKVVLVGNAGVGKTCLVRKFTQGIFPPGQSATIGVDFMIKTLKVLDDKIKLQIWDTAGQERFRSITQSYYRSAHAIVLVFDVSCQPSFDSLPDWLSEIEQYANRRVLKILVGNKVDKDDEREIPERIGKSFADANGFEYFLETSALGNCGHLKTQQPSSLNVVLTKIMPGRGGARKRAAPEVVPPEDEDYQLKRQRNNAAVNKTRQKKRQEESDTAARVEEMRQENAKLERKVESLQRELQFLKEMFVAYASNKKDDDGTGHNNNNGQPPPGGSAAA